MLKGGVGDYVLSEQAGAWTTSTLPICVECVGEHACRDGGPGMHVLRND